MKIVIFENEVIQIEGAINYLNARYFHNSIIVEYYATSQSAEPFSKYVDYNLIFVDIELSPKSKYDGFTVLSKLNEIGLSNKIVILTGYSKVDEKLIELGLPKYEILQKPFTFDSLKKILDKYYS